MKRILKHTTLLVLFLLIGAKSVVANSLNYNNIQLAPLSLTSEKVSTFDFFTFSGLNSTTDKYFIEVELTDEEEEEEELEEKEVLTKISSLSFFNFCCLLDGNQISVNNFKHPKPLGSNKALYISYSQFIGFV